MVQSLSKRHLFKFNEIMYVGLVFHLKIKNFLIKCNSFTNLTMDFGLIFS